ncbi:hypothetical protein HPP92_013767 [Vanilla planifolia]|uniref:Uncharacterized protein n=1 Tax=Vanilla planifolia TaxID=51239 RepID=A0A835PH74_VANPL|nr:hypothetical protein HPP92_026489 [Vanilla planifolia]KAG0479048.1 hypothetical protein HPP92_013767 [Vanilla planifolia]
MEKTLHDPLELDMEEWENLPDNTFLDLGLKEVKNLLSKEIIFANYFREEPELIPKAELSEERISNVFHELESTDIVASSPETGTVVILEPQQDSTGKEEESSKARRRRRGRRSQSGKDLASPSAGGVSRQSGLCAPLEWQPPPPSVSYYSAGNGISSCRVAITTILKSSVSGSSPTGRG